MLPLDRIHVIRHQFHNEGQSERTIARNLGLSRNTVHRYLNQEIQPGIRKKPSSSLPSTEERHKYVRDFLQKHTWTAKQRPTSARLAELLAQEGLTLSPRTLRRILAEEKRSSQEVFVPLLYPNGDLAQVDFFEITAVLAGQSQKLFLFVLRSMASGRDFACLFRWQDTNCFLEGHLRAFRHFDAIPRRITYDNLKPAVQKFLGRSTRKLAPRFQALLAQFPFEACFARPRTGHDKGGVEARGKAIRWQHLSPVPTAQTLEELNQQLLERLDRPFSKPEAQQRWKEDQAQMLSFSPEGYNPADYQQVTASRSALVRVGGAQYSVPSTWQGLPIATWCGAEQVVLQKGTVQVVHPRVAKGKRQVDYHHYLTPLSQKPQALAQVAGPLMEQLGPEFSRAWGELLVHRGRLDAACAMAHILKMMVKEGFPVAKQFVERCWLEQNWTAWDRPKEPEGGTLVPHALQEIEVESRGLSHFDRLLGGAV